ncbi:MAG TPA: ubiquinol oxidase subunit II [Candidatus Saccharimonadales bacterium]|nr:ubiquinol oxidase subunit II [Candidatus Saccharimonadales bacterium]
MSSKNKAVLGGLAFLAVIILAYIRLHSLSIPVLETRGVIAHKERSLILLAVGLCAIVVIPVYVMLVGFAWKYRAGNKNSRYEPNFDHSRLFESLWWGIPLTIIAILAVMAWRSSHELDPFKPLASSNPPLTIQVVSLQWKWLFIYPRQGIASVNYLRIPVNTPISFEITSDAPMNSFWIPQLGGQIYAMSGMSTKLSLMASQTGKYYGESANISGDGFAGMHFLAEATNQPAFTSWAAQTKKENSKLSLNTYSLLAKPSQNNPVAYYGNVSQGLYSYVVNKFITPPNFSPVEAL